MATANWQTMKISQRLQREIDGYRNRREPITRIVTVARERLATDFAMPAQTTVQIAADGAGLTYDEMRRLLWEVAE